MLEKAAHCDVPRGSSVAVGTANVGTSAEASARRMEKRVGIVFVHQDSEASKYRYAA